MSCEEKDRNLINHFAGVELRPCFGISGCHDLGRQIFGGGARGDLCHARFGQLGDQLANTCRTGAGVFAKQARHPSGQGHEGGQIKDRLLR